ncbi:MAG: 2-amino-4-hydroxy-6-hydroxymethyldihydropteridine diphosphokinase [Paludibacteraceae bacterium]|nr:2-amino-4-hydroxy-6-hydroxymethyldihydropteridine diphosphokinase [Paludibacteraceae bacterium]
MYRYYLSLGSNLGEREQRLIRAAELIAARIGCVEAVSSFYYSEPWGFESANMFCNTCLRLRTSLSPCRLLEATQRIERELGRMTKSLNGEYHDRPIDIDLIMGFQLNQASSSLSTTNTDKSTTQHSSVKSSVAVPCREIRRETKHLTLPHPLMHQRDFVMVPLREILLPCDAQLTMSFPKFRQ